MAAANTLIVMKEALTLCNTNDMFNCSVSAKDHAITVKALASGDSNPEDFNRPGHIFPLKYREGGVLKRAGHTEASVDLAMLAGLNPVAVICEIVDDDGSMARLPRLQEFAKKENLKIIPAMWGPFTTYCYKSYLDGIEHIAVVKGEIGDGQDILLRVHSECLTGDIFGSARCDCGNHLALAMKQIEAAGKEVLVYLRGHEGRGIGLGHKLRAYNLYGSFLNLFFDFIIPDPQNYLAIISRNY
ncbi:Bifunctional riboflavin biosynthesis protein RIBA 1 chloroplastic [Bienertia sinuspersici]